MQDGIVFRVDELDRFWGFIHERQSIWNRRIVQRLPRSEWTKDPVLQRNKFTNIYRELDPGTQFVFNNILEHDEYPREDRVFNVMLYRLMCSIPTYRGLGFQRLFTFDSRDFEVYLKEIYESGEPVFGNAYLISPYSSMGSDLKYVNVARLFALVREAFLYGGFFDKLDFAPSFEEAFKTINSLYGFGPFLAYQIMVDLTYPLPNTKYGSAIIPYNQNDWARLGPGALRGYARLTSTNDGTKGLRGLRWLQANQRSEFLRVGVDFPFLVEHQKGGTNVEMEISLANLQNCLCEYHKYRSIQDGTGKSQRIFVPSVYGAETGRLKWDAYTGSHR